MVNAMLARPIRIFHIQRDEHLALIEMNWSSAARGRAIIYRLLSVPLKLASHDQFRCLLYPQTQPASKLQTLKPTTPRGKVRASSNYVCTSVWSIDSFPFSTSASSRPSSLVSSRRQPRTLCSVPMRQHDVPRAKLMPPNLSRAFMDGHWEQNFVIGLGEEPEIPVAVFLPWIWIPYSKAPESLGDGWGN